MPDRLIGLIFFIIGIAVLLWTYYYPDRKDNPLSSNGKGYIAGIIFVVIGLMLLLGLGVWK